MMSADIEHAAGTQATNADPEGTDIAPLPGSYDPGSRSNGNGAAPVANANQPPAIDEMIDEVIDVERVARLLHVGRNTVYALVARSAIPHRRLGKQIRFNRAVIMRWLDSWSSQGAKERQ